MKQLRSTCFSVLFVFSVCIFYSSCISMKKVERLFTSTPAPFSIDAINGVYANVPVVAEQKAFYRRPSPTLWEILDESNRYFKGFTKVSEAAEVSLTYLDNNRLKAVLRCKIFQKSFY